MGNREKYHTITLLGIHGVGKTTILASLLSQSLYRTVYKIKTDECCVDSDFSFSPERDIIEYKEYDTTRHGWREGNINLIVEKIIKGEYPDRTYINRDESAHGTRLTTFYKAVLPFEYKNNLFHVDIVDAAGFIIWLMGYMSVTKKNLLTKEFAENAVDIFIDDAYFESKGSKELARLKDDYKLYMKDEGNIKNINNIINSLRNEFAKSSIFILLLPPQINIGIEIMYREILYMIKKKKKPVLLVIGKIDKAFRNGLLSERNMDFNNRQNIERSLIILKENYESVDKKIEEIIQKTSHLRIYRNIIKGYGFIAGAIEDPVNNNYVYVDSSKKIHSLNVQSIINRAIDML